MCTKAAAICAALLLGSPEGQAAQTTSFVVDATSNSQCTQGVPNTDCEAAAGEIHGGITGLSSDCEMGPKPAIHPARHAAVGLAERRDRRVFLW